MIPVIPDSSPNYLSKKAQSERFIWILNTPLQGSVKLNRSLKKHFYLTLQHSNQIVLKHLCKYTKQNNRSAFLKKTSNQEKKAEGTFHYSLILILYKKLICFYFEREKQKKDKKEIKKI